MKKSLSVLLLFTLFVINNSIAQTVYESFSDADFTSNPTWSGDVGAFTVVTNSDAAAGATSSNTLRLNYGTSAADNQYLSTQIATWDDIQTWGFFIGRRSQAFTASNELHIWLYANESNLESATVDGYRLAIGDDSGDDEIRLQVVTDGTATTILTSSSSITNGITDIGFLIRVTRSQSGLWTFYSSTLPTTSNSGAIATDIPSAANTPNNLGSVTNSTYTPAANGYFGLVCEHATSASARTSTEFDQFYFDTQTANLTTFGIAATNTPTTIDFDNAVTGVNGAAFNGGGFDTSFASGKLNSSAFKVIGLSDGNTSFGGTSITGDFARGTSSGGESTGGIYAFDTDNGAGTNYGLGFQPSSNDFTPGEIVLKTFNETGTTVNNILISYAVKTYNDQGFSTTVNPSYSTDDINYTALTNYNYTSSATADVSPAWTTTTFSILIDNLTLATGLPFYFKWTSDDDSGSGSRDELALDDISITLNPSITAYYYDGSGNISSTSNWGTNTDGSGTNPANFTDPLQYFYLQNVTSVSTSASLTISGSGSKLIVGDGTTSTTLTLLNTTPLVATVDVSASSTLVLQHITFPTLGTLAATSTVKFNTGTNIDLPVATYGNLMIENSTVNNPSTATDLVFQGDLWLLFGASINCSNYNLHTSGTSNQTIYANGNTLSVGYLENNNTYSKTGTLTLGSSSNITLAGRIIMNNTGAANAFIDGGNTITVGDDIYLGGDTAGYQLTGTFVLNAASGAAIIANETSNGIAVPYFNNITIATTGTATTTVRPLGGSGDLKIGGNLAITSTSSGAISLNNNNIYLYGDFTSTQTTDLITEGGSTLLFMKNGTQSFDISASTSNSFNKLKIGSNSILTLSGDLTLADTLILNGQLKTTAATLQLDGFADLGANHNFSFDGTSSLAFNGATINETLNIDQTTSGTTNKLNNLTFSSTSGSLTLNHALQVKGAVTLNDGTLNTNDLLTLFSDSSATGYLAEITGTGALSGKLTMQRYISGTADYRELASCVTSTFADWDSTLITSGFTGSDYPSYNFNNIYSWNESATTALDTNVYVGVTNITDTLKPGIGYTVYVYPDTGNFPLTIATSGTPQTGNFTFDVSLDGTGSYSGYNFVGNPYPCAIDWDAAAWTKTNIGTTIYIWDYANQQYDAWQTGVGGTNGGSNIIPSSRAFWVKATAASPQLIATEACKSAGQGTFYKSSLGLGIITATLHSGNKSDEAKIIWNPAASQGHDAGLDANKMWNYGSNPINLYSKTQATQPLVFNHIGNALHQAETVEIWARVSAAGTYTVDFSNMENLTPEKIVVTPTAGATVAPFCLAQNTSLSFTAATANAEIHLATLEIYPEIAVEKVNATCQNTTDGSITIQAGLRDSIELKNAAGQNITGVVNGNSIHFSNLEAGTYQLISYYSGLCNTQHQQQITIAPETKIVEGITATDSIEFNTLFVCTANDTLCQSYIWNWGDSTQTTGAVSETHTYTSFGLKTVRLDVSKNGCETAFSKEVFIVEPNAVQELTVANSTLFFNGKEVVVQTDSNESYTITFYTIDGKIIKTIAQKIGSANINVTGFAAGTYITQMTAKSGKATQLKFTLAAN